MIKKDETGLSFLSFENTGRIARIPIEKRGTSTKGRDWTLGSVLLEVYDETENGSARLFLNTFDGELIERINTIGVGKDVKVRWHVSVRDNYDSYRTANILDSIEFLTDGENFLIGDKKK